MDWGALGDYTKDLSQARRSPNPFVKKAAGPCETGDGERLSAFRAGATHLGKRFAAGEHVQAAFGGLQDSAPRAALLALHARMEDVGPGAWEDPKLVQIWLRWADYLVPRRGVAVFTVGALPRLPAQRSALHHLADAVVSVLDGRARTTRQVAESMPELPGPTVVRLGAVTGKVHIRWDAHTTVLVPAERAEPAGTSEPTALYEPDEEDARRELARRFLAWLARPGPLTSPSGVASGGMMPKRHGGALTGNWPLWPSTASRPAFWPGTRTRSQAEARRSPASGCCPWETLTSTPERPWPWKRHPLSWRTGFTATG